MKPKVYVDDVSTEKQGFYRCLCPFHKEETPSFFILLEKDIYYCFSCGEKGEPDDLDILYNVSAGEVDV